VGLVAAPASGSGKEQNAAPRVYLRRSSQAFISGTILIDGKSTILHVSVGSKSLSFNLAKGYQYIDCNGDGKIDDMSTSFEMGFAKGGPVVFHVGSGDRYVSIERIDVARKAVTLAVHPKSDYDRIELQVGREVPDFEFIALDGSKRHLSDFRGKYLLMDFWGTWCGPCVGDLPLIKKAYDTYKDKGFEVLGMDTELPDVTAEDFEKGLAKVKAFVAERGIPWLQARTESIKPLYERRFMIVAYPTYVLLGPDGTIIRLSGLHGEELGKTLAALFNGK
jgi:thiol-disulfide isomerase/thioredoxin